MKQITTVKVMASLCADDKAGPNNQYVESGKLVIVYDDMGRTPIRGIQKDAESRTTAAFRRKLWGGTENIVTEERYAVRRLTPLEAERLQGLPDGWTLIDDKTCSDSARYKAIGNGMAQPIATWLIKRIVEEVENEPTISSES